MNRSVNDRRWLRSFDSVQTYCAPLNCKSLGPDQNSKRLDNNNAATQVQWSRTEERMLSERSRAIPDAIPKMSAPPTMRNHCLIWIWPLAKLRNRRRDAPAYSAVDIKVGQERHHGPPLFCIGSRAARCPRITPRKSNSAPSGKRRAARPVYSKTLPVPIR